MDIYNNINKTEQNVYDTYNNFVFSSDTRVFNKMIKKTELKSGYSNKGRSE